MDYSTEYMDAVTLLHKLQELNLDKKVSLSMNKDYFI